MSKNEKIKEQIGWLKVVFGLLFATDISLIAYLFNWIETLSVVKTVLVVLSLCIVTISLYYTNKSAIKKIESLEEL
jgi:membrane protein YdbS with pleckstrin-like domain